MSPTDAAKLLDLPAEATPEQLETRFLELRPRLEDKIAKAPTPGLKAKYRESLEQITTAFETLALAADSSALPVLNKQSAISTQPSASNAAPVGGVPSPREASRSSPPPKKSGGREFLIVALIAVAVLGAGGWWVMKIRAENAEQARLAAEAKSEQERKAEDNRLAAEAKRKADDDEKARVAAAAKAEQDRLEKLSAQLRGELAEYKIEWEALEREERNAERRLAELKSDTRSLRDAPAGKVAEMQAHLSAQQDYSEWLSDTLARHPARIARSRAEELLSAKQVDLATIAVSDLKAALDRVTEEIPKQRTARLAVESTLAIRTDPEANWTLTDAFARVRTGRGSAQVDRVAFGPVRVEFAKALWPLRVETPVVSRSQPSEVVADFTGHELKLASTPVGAEVRGVGGKSLGVTPLQLTSVPPGAHALTLHKEGYYDEPLTVALPQSTSDAPIAVVLRPLPVGLVKPERWIVPERLTMESRSQLVMDYSASTGLYAGTAASTTRTADVEEWDFSQPDAQDHWQQLHRRIVRQDREANFAPYAITGAALVYSRQANGRWYGSFLKGAPSDPTIAKISTDVFPASWLLEFGSDGLWPTKDTNVGGTWTIKPTSLPGMNLLVNLTGTVQGKLLALERTRDVERAEIEYSFSVESGPDNYRARQVGSYRLHVDLRAMYVISYEYRDRYSSRLAATPKDVMAVEAQTHYTIQLTKR